MFAQPTHPTIGLNKYQRTYRSSCSRRVAFRSVGQLYNAQAERHRAQWTISSITACYDVRAELFTGSNNNNNINHFGLHHVDVTDARGWRYMVLPACVLYAAVVVVDIGEEMDSMSSVESAVLDLESSDPSESQSHSSRMYDRWLVQWSISMVTVPYVLCDVFFSLVSL